MTDSCTIDRLEPLSYAFKTGKIDVSELVERTAALNSLDGLFHDSKNTIAKEKHFFTLPSMQKKWDTTMLALTIAFIAIVFVSPASADEKMSVVQTALNSTTISGHVQSGAFVPPQNPFNPSSLSRFRTGSRIFESQLQIERSRWQSTGSTSLSPLPPPLFENSVEENPLLQSSSFVLMLVDAPIQPLSPISALDSSSFSVELSLAGSPVPQMIPNYALGSSFGVEMTSPILAFTMPQAPPILPPSVIELQLNQAGIQPVPTPEPSALALSSLALGLIALARLSRRQGILK